MSEDSVLNVKSRILELCLELEKHDLNEIEQWISSASYRNDLKVKLELQKTEKKLIKIGNAIKKLVPFEAELPTEKIIPPSIGDQADCNETNTYHIDEFLYDQEEVDKLTAKGSLNRHYCVDCGSRNVKELTLISHSMSRQMLQYVFKSLLPKDLGDKQILDVGSRIGAVVFGAYYLTNASKIIGVEMNKECCAIQERIIDQFTMDKERIKIIHSDVMDSPDLIQASDVVIINVLDFFVDIEKHKEMWNFFKKNMKKGSYLVTNRSMADTLGYLDLFEEFIDWLDITKPCQLENEIYFDIEDSHEIFLYMIK